MNQQNDNTEELIRQLQLSKPQLHEPELLTNSIMSALPERNKSNSVILNRIRILSGIAAIFLLALFVFQQNDTETLYSVQPSKFVQNSISEESLKYCYAQSDLSLIQMYRCYLNQNTIKNQKFRTFNNKFNKNSHENFD